MVLIKNIYRKIAIKKITYALLLGASALCSCQPQPVKIEQCWSESTKKEASELATQMMYEAIYDDWPAGKIPTDADKEKIHNLFKVELSSFYIRSADRDTGNFQCGASISVKYTSLDNSPESTGNVLEFSLVNGEKGQAVIENRLIFSNIVHEMGKTLNARKSEK